jgi:Caspase domain
MSKIFAIHIGLNNMNPDHYILAEYPKLTACVNDAITMKELTKDFTKRAKMLIGNDATAVNVKKEITKFALGVNALGISIPALSNGDLLVVTYSGHGSEVNDINGDELAKKDQTWCLYERQLIDDELAQLWSLFAEGVRILLISDSCHSGTIVADTLSPTVFAFTETNNLSWYQSISANVSTILNNFLFKKKKSIKTSEVKQVISRLLKNGQTVVNSKKKTTKTQLTS